MHSWLSGINLGPKELIGEMNVYLVLLLPAYLLVEGSPSYNISFMFITSFGEFGINSSGVVPAAEMAVRDINYRSALLPGYVLTYDAVRDSQVSSRLSIIRILCSASFCRSQTLY